MNADERNTDGSTVQQYLSFSLGAETFAVPVNRAREIMDFKTVTKVPQVPDYMLGVINLRGSVLPVIDLRRRLNMPAAEQSNDSCIIVVEVATDDSVLVLGAVADGVREVFDLTDDQIEPPPRIGTQLRTDFIQGMAQRDGQLIICLNIENVMGVEQLEHLQEVIAV